MQIMLQREVFIDSSPPLQKLDMQQQQQQQQQRQQQQHQQQLDMQTNLLMSYSFAPKALHSCPNNRAFYRGRTQGKWKC